MLSFDRGTPVAIALDKAGKTIYTIRVTEEEEDPDIEADDVLGLIDRIDIQELKQAMRLGLIETKVLTKALRTNNREGLSENLRRAYDILREKAEMKLKREITFDRKSEVHQVIPVIGHRPEKYDRSVAFFGPSGSGKSYLAKSILANDLHKRPVIVFSKVRDDPSLRELAKLKTPVDDKPRLIQVPIFTDQDLVDLPTDSDLKGTICFFDDIDAMAPARAAYLRDYRDALLEAGRHKDVTVFSTSHILRNYNKTRVVLNELEWAFTYPNASRRSADIFMQDRLGFDKATRETLIARSGSSGRYLGFKLSVPNLMIHTKGVQLI